MNLFAMNAVAAAVNRAGSTYSGWTPQSSADLEMWYDVSDQASITLDGTNNISQWDDLSGNGRHISQGTVASRPPTDKFGVYDAPFFDGNGDHLQTSSNFTLPPDSWVIALMGKKHDARNGSNNGLMEIGDLNKFGIYHRPDSTADYLRILFNFRGLSSPNGSYSRSVIPPHVLTFIKVVNSYVAIRMDGVELARSTDATMIAQSSTVADIFRLGKASGGGVVSWSGTIAEMTWDSGAADQALAELYEGYMAHKWGTTSRLPAGHPYKNSPPAP